MKFIATILIGIMLPFTFTGTAEATRAKPEAFKKDVCKNIKGKQSIVDVINGRWEFKIKKNGKPSKRVCVKGWRQR